MILPHFNAEIAEIAVELFRRVIGIVREEEKLVIGPLKAVDKLQGARDEGAAAVYDAVHVNEKGLVIAPVFRS